jgi:hypothetical protein
LLASLSLPGVPPVAGITAFAWHFSCWCKASLLLHGAYCC